MIFEVLERMIEEATFLTEESDKRATLSSRAIQTSVRLILPGELAKHAITEGTKAVTKYMMSKSGPKSQRAGTVFPISFIMSLLKKKSRLRVGQGAPVYLTAVCEYLCAEVLELAGNAAKDARLSRVTPRHIMLAIRSDEELDKFFKGYVAFGGVVPHINSSLLKSAQGGATPALGGTSSAFGGPIAFGSTNAVPNVAFGFGKAKPAKKKKASKHDSDDDEEDEDED